MEFGLATYGLGWVAGVLSTLSPCVLPLLPILLATAADAHPRAPLALAAGLALSYALVGTTLAWAAGSLALDATLFRAAGAVLLGGLGLVMSSGPLQQRFALSTSGIGDAGHRLLDRVRPEGLGGQFALGLILGVIWSPCVGPTLGAAILLASQGSQLPQVGLLMGVFGLGAATPVVALAFMSRSLFGRLRATMLNVGKQGKLVLGLVMIAIAALILTGLDKQLESWLVERSPQWLTSLTTHF